MAISVKDIKEKDFSAQKHGYAIEEVDDFLDEIADQVSELIRENMSLKAQLEEAYAQPKAEPVVIEKESAQPDFDDRSYFNDLQNAMRESLINANRIAEETRKQAEQEAANKVSAAQIQAETITAEARAEVDACKAELQALREAIAKYRGDFHDLIKEQLEVIKNREELFN